MVARGTLITDSLIDSELTRLRENVRKMCFSGALMPVEALNMRGAVSPLGHTVLAELLGIF